jgi:GT2 family glycosyltransferase
VLLQLQEPISDQIMHLAWPLLQSASTVSAKTDLLLLADLRQQLVLEQEGLSCIVKPQGADGFRLRYPLTGAVSSTPVANAASPQVSIIIPTRDQLALTRACVESVLTQTRYRNFEILLVDNQSSDPDTLRWFSSIDAHPQVRLLRFDAAFNYSAINNFAVAQSQAPFVCLLNNDTAVISPDWLDEMLQHAQRPQIGCVGAKLLFDDNTVQHGGVVLGLWGLAGHSHKHALADSAGYQQRLTLVQNYSAVTAACLLVRRALFLQVGGLNEQALPVAFNDVDLCLKIQAAGYRNLWTPYAAHYHFESKSRGREDTPAKKARERAEINYMRQTWPVQIADDACYSPHLTRRREDYSIAADEPAAMLQHWLR